MVHIITYWWLTGIEPLTFVYNTRESALIDWNSNISKVTRFLDDGRVVVGSGHGQGSVMIAISSEVPQE